jgi:hypothetical protein
MAYLDLKSDGKSSMPGKQRLLKASKAGRCETRVISVKLDCLKSNLQKVSTRTRRNDA